MADAVVPPEGWAEWARELCWGMERRRAAEFASEPFRWTLPSWIYEAVVRSLPEGAWWWTQPTETRPLAICNVDVVDGRN